MKASSHIAFFLMAAIIVLNLNGVLYMLTGVVQLMTPILVLCVLVLTVNLFPKLVEGVGGVGKVYLAAVLSYLFIGFIASVVNGIDLKLSYIIAYSISILTVMCVAAFSYSYLIEHRQSFIKPMFFLVFAASCSILLSPILATVYRYAPAETDRGFGFFANPNEGGILTVLGLGLLIAVRLPMAMKALLYAVLAINVVMTFSKASMLLFGLVSLGAFVASDFRVKSRYSVLIFAGLALAAYIIPTLYDNLDGVRKRRVDQVIAIVAKGEINADTTSSRSDLWEIGLDKISENAFLGNGLGQLHHMQGGITSDGVHQGVHNVFLMLWGEAGVVALLIFLFFCLSYLLNWVLLIRSMPRALLTVSMVSFICLFMDMMSAHNVLNLRMHNLFLGLSLGFFAYYNSLNKSKGVF